MSSVYWFLECVACPVCLHLFGLGCVAEIRVQSSLLVCLRENVHSGMCVRLNMPRSFLRQ
jgi:hypothetical protein